MSSSSKYGEPFTATITTTMPLLLATSVLALAGCTNDVAPSLRGDPGSKAIHTGAPMPDGAGAAPAPDAGACNGPAKGSVVLGPIVGPTARFVDLCQSGGCTEHGGKFFDPSQVALDYGDFPFRPVHEGSIGNPVGEYFYAVVAPGHESAIDDGAPGNLSDSVASAVPRDQGHGDTRADRTIVISPDQTPTRFPTSHGTHSISFPPSQFMAISLAPFDATPDGRYVLAVCPTSVTSRCGCVFEPFTVLPPPDAGAPRPDASAPRPDASTPRPDGGTPRPDGGTPRPDGGAGGAPCSTALQH